MEYDLRDSYAYLLEAMIFAKAAAENGGKVDMLTVDFTTEFGYGEGEMFFQHFLPQLAKQMILPLMTTRTTPRNGNLYILN